MPQDKLISEEKYNHFRDDPRNKLQVCAYRTAADLTLSGVKQMPTNMQLEDAIEIVLKLAKQSVIVTKGKHPEQIEAIKVVEDYFINNVFD